LSAEAIKPTGMVFSQAVIIPTDGTAHLNVIAVDPPSRVMRGRDTAGDPILQPAKAAQVSRQCTRARSCLTFQLHQVEFGYTSFSPEIGWQANFGERSSFDIKRKALHGACAEIPSANDALRRNATKGLGHGKILRFNLICSTKPVHAV